MSVLDTGSQRRGCGFVVEMFSAEGIADVTVLERLPLTFHCRTGNDIMIEETLNEIPHDRIASEFEKMLKDGPKKRKSRAEHILERHKPAIAKLVAQGHPASAIHGAMKFHGVIVPLAGVRQYVASIAPPKKPK
jgi:hypothetical protein